MSRSRVRLVGAVTIGLLSMSCSAERAKRALDGGDEPSTAFDDDDDAGGQGGGAANPPLSGLDAGGGEKGRPGDVCAEFPIPAYNQTPEILIVLDRSGSMRDATVDRWGPSSSAVESIVASLQGSIDFGLLTFPGDCLTLVSPADQAACISRLGGLDQSLSCEPGRVDVEVGKASGQIVGEQLKKTVPTGATPTAASIRAAAKALVERPAHKGQGAQSILLVTDGAPNCSLGWGGLLAIGGNSASGQSEAVTQTVDAIDVANKTGVRTYVIGYQTQADAFLRGSLDKMAKVGGTGELSHRPVEDQASLVFTLQQLTQKALLCELRLDNPVTDPTQLRIKLSGQTLAQDPVNGFTLGADNRTISLNGTACDALRASNGGVTAQAQVLCPQPAPEDAGTPGDSDAGLPGDAVDAGDAGENGPIAI